MTSRPKGGESIKDFVTTVVKLITKMCDDRGGGVQNCPKFRDVIYGQP